MRAMVARLKRVKERGMGGSSIRCIIEPGEKNFSMLEKTFRKMRAGGASEW